MDSTTQGEIFPINDCAPQTETPERVNVPFKQLGRVRDRKGVPFALGIFNCVLGFIQIVLRIVLADFVANDRRYGAKRMPPALFALKDLAGDLGNFQGTLWSGMLLLLAGIAVILTRMNSSTAMLLFSALTSFLAPLSCFGTIGSNVSTIRFQSGGYLRYDEIYIMILSAISLAAAGGGGSIIQSVFSFRYLLEDIERKTDSVHQQQQRQLPRQLPDSMIFDRNVVTRRLKRAVISLGTAEIVCGLVILAIQSHAAAEIKIHRDQVSYHHLFLTTPIGSHLRLVKLMIVHVPGILAGVILCISGSFGVMLSKCNFSGVLIANIALSMLATGFSFTANFTAIEMLVPETDELAGFSWPKSIISFSAIAVVVCIAHSSLCCKMQCRQEDDEIVTVITPSVQINDAYSNANFSGVQSTSPYPTHDIGLENGVSELKPASGQNF